MKITVIGSGLIGGSVVLKAAERGHRISVCDTDPRTRTAVVRRGINVHDQIGSWVDDQDLIVMATPLDALDGVAGALAEQDGDWTLTDVGSVKTPVLEIVRRHGLEERYVGAHPMAGTEHSGFGSAHVSLLTSKVWAVTPGSPERTLWLVRWLLNNFGARIVVTTPQEHDRSVARISHVGHVLANLMLGTTQSGLDRTLAASSFRDATRVAGGDLHRTASMLAYNREAARDVLQTLMEGCEAAMDALGADEPIPALEDLFQPALEVERRMNDRTKHPVLHESSVEGIMERCRQGYVVGATKGDQFALARPRGAPYLGGWVTTVE